MKPIQQAILEYLSRQLTYVRLGEIADALGVSKTTVSFHTNLINIRTSHVIESSRTLGYRLIK
jgi:predicted ArsR family transcriptional regulator